MLWTLPVQVTLNVKSPLSGAFFLLRFGDSSQRCLVSPDLVFQNWFEAHLLRGIELALETCDLQIDSVAQFGFIEFNFNCHCMAPYVR